MDASTRRRGGSGRAGQTTSLGLSRRSPLFMLISARSSRRPRRPPSLSPYHPNRTPNHAALNPAGRSYLPADVRKGRTFCAHCGALLVPGINCRVRLAPVRGRARPKPKHVRALETRPDASGVGGTAAAAPRRGRKDVANVVVRVKPALRPSLVEQACSTASVRFLQLYHCNVCHTTTEFLGVDRASKVSKAPKPVAAPVAAPVAEARPSKSKGPTPGLGPAKGRESVPSLSMPVRSATPARPARPPPAPAPRAGSAGKAGLKALLQQQQQQTTSAATSGYSLQDFLQSLQ